MSDSAYDVLVLGAGPGGYVAAIRCAQLGLRTAIVEKRFWGGVCLNIGCIPSKALLRNAELVHLLRTEAAAFGIQVQGSVSFDFGEAVRRSRRVADGRAKGVRFLMRKNAIDTFEGDGTFLDPHRLQVQAADGTTSTLTFQHAILAVGATPRLVPGTQLSDRVVTYEAQIVDERLPARVVIIGGGPIGVEFGWLLHAYGSQVTIVERLPRLVPTEDEEVGRELQRRYQRAGLRVMTGAQVQSIEETADDVQVVVTTPDGTAETLAADRVIQAIGFRPRTEGFGLASTGVELDQRGGVAIDDRMRTSQPHIRAIGDVTGKLMLAHVAEAMALVAAEDIAGLHPEPLDYTAMPRATFSHPQIASFGLTEAEARARGFEVQVARFPFQANGKAQGLGEPAGFVKLLGEAGSGRMLGAHLIGPEVTELLPELTLAHLHELSAHELAHNVHAHPTLSEAVKDAAHVLAGTPINV